MNELTRRAFVKLTASAAALLSFRPGSVMAGPFTAADFEKLVPADKKLSPAWVKSLFERGTPEVLRGANLKYVGMPIGGLCSGHLYLGGDGRLWHWDIFNQHVKTGADHYAKPPDPDFALEQGFALRLGGKTFALDRTGFSDVSFRGEYPIGRVEYRDAAVPLAVNLEAFSPFIPLNTDDSSLPATVMRFTVTNTGSKKVEAELAGWLENAVCLHSGASWQVVRRNRIVRRKGLLLLDCLAETAPAQTERPTIVFADFDGETYGDWKVEGDAFGQAPARGPMSKPQRLSGHQGKGLVNSYLPSDQPRGRLISPPFTIERSFIAFLIGGGSHPGETCINLRVDGNVVLTATGKNSDALEWSGWNVADLAGKTAQIEIVDNHSAGWGHIDIDQIEFCDRLRDTPARLQEAPDYGTMSLALLEPARADKPMASLPDGTAAEAAFRDQPSATDRTKPYGRKLVGALKRKLVLKPGQSATATFVVAWHFPNLTITGVRPNDQERVKNAKGNGRYYAARFADAAAVANYCAEHFDRLASQTRLWRDVWYDSTLPYWFLDRTMLNTSILATSTCFRFASGRFWAWEGVGCCAGTCGHVWQYAHAMARQFPELERILRERTDFGLALQADGAIHFRGENNKIPAIDAQAGSILRALREHQMSADNTFLRRIWPGVKRATDWLIAKDGDGDGLIEGNQHNTLDADWFGPIAWLSGLYLAALAAAATLSDEMRDAAYAEKCRAILARGQKKLVAGLFDGDYFINKVDPKHLDAINSGTGCEIDQVMGQSWAFQVGLPRVLPEKETKTALQSLWKYNFSPDVGPYRERYKPGRWYAMAGEAGLLMCTFPRSDWSFEQAAGQGKGKPTFAGYFNECMNGFEYQVAGHMVWENMVLEGLAITRAVHDRYHASKRNPWNEVECGNHYARSMASYGVFTAACGYEYHGPNGHLGFAPRLTPNNFRAPFTAAEGWGTFSQKLEARSSKFEIAVMWGKLRLKSLSLAVPEGLKVSRLTASLDNGRAVGTKFTQTGNRVTITLAKEIVLAPGKPLNVSVS